MIARLSDKPLARGEMMKIKLTLLYGLIITGIDAQAVYPCDIEQPETGTEKNRQPVRCLSLKSMLKVK
ncbi:hypothetical protein chiPu_0008098 [Chiloscyllium punctatum]|uniref:Uncharacterized protein n=1 Tax=Chiloscyllium punctatum TaxID=137246 RepID=A0A401SH23_CHIPU|nr:hypothetical protein [Chiloscyllium punctatum]